MAQLQEHFKMDYKNILPNINQIIKGDKYRITVLSNILIRLEYSETGMFEDRPTELVLNRNFNSCEYEVHQDQKYLTIETKYFKLTYEKNMPFIGNKVTPDQYLKIDLKDTDKYWYFNHPEARNFGGTAYSLDNVDGRTKYLKGLYSTDGFVSIDDSNSLIFNEDGSLAKRTDKRLDVYVFMYKRDFGDALRDYFTLTGYPPLIPRYSLGVMWNRNTKYTTKTIENLVYNFNKHNIPLSVIMLSNEWHRANNKMNYGFTYNEEYFKKPKKLNEFLHNKNIKVAVEINPFEGIGAKEDYYLPFKKASGLEGEGKLPFNVYNVNVLNAYFDYLIHPLMNEGVDFFWLNYNNEKDIMGLRTLVHYHFDDFKQITNRRGIVFARNSVIAAHRNPIMYTGETLVSWKNLEMLPAFNSNASNIGISWISNDIGGYKDGIEDGELYSRFVQFGCFSPILRLACDDGNYYKREPWRWDMRTQGVVSEYLRLRHRLIPYLYSEAYKYHKIGLPLVQPLYYRYPEVYDEPAYKNEYYFGTSMFVAPICSPLDSVMDRTILKLFLPDGIWYDFTTGKKYNGGKRYTAFYKLQDYPVFVKAGTILPMAILDEKKLNDTNPPKVMEIQVFPGESNTYELYEDDGISSLYEKDYFLVTNIDYTYQKNNYTLTIRPVSGKSGIIPDHRSYRIRFRNVLEPEEVTVHIGNEKVKGVETYSDENDFIVELPGLSTLKQITVTCKGKNIEIDSVRLINEDIDAILNDLPIKTKTKDIIGRILLSNTELRKKRIEVRKLKKYGVSQKYITLFLKLLEYLA